MKYQEDIALAAQIKRGDDRYQAIRDLDTKCRGIMHKVLTIKFGNRLADYQYTDFIDDALLKAEKKIKEDKYDAKASLCTWVSRILTNMVLDYLRHQKVVDKHAKSVKDLYLAGIDYEEEDIFECEKKALILFQKEEPKVFSLLMLIKVHKEKYKDMEHHFEKTGDDARKHIYELKMKLKKYIENLCGKRI